MASLCFTAGFPKCSGTCHSFCITPVASHGCRLPWRAHLHRKPCERRDVCVFTNVAAVLDTFHSEARRHSLHSVLQLDLFLPSSVHILHGLWMGMCLFGGVLGILLWMGPMWKVLTHGSPKPTKQQAELLNDCDNFQPMEWSHTDF